jgi:hypothetical protein
MVDDKSLRLNELSLRILTNTRKRLEKCLPRGQTNRIRVSDPTEECTPKNRCGNV